MSRLSRLAGLVSSQEVASIGLTPDVLDVLPMIAFVVNPSTEVVTSASQSAYQSGLVYRDRVNAPKLRELIAKARMASNPIDKEIVIDRSPLDGGSRVLQARAAAVDPHAVLVLVTDLTMERNVEAMRRDFVVNVSHELKTPVGALGLLAEAILADVDDSEQVQHFATRIELESHRLSNLIGDIVELSKLQGEEIQTVFEPVRLNEVVNLAVDAVASAAEAKNIAIVQAEPIDVVVEGSKSQLVTALRNLVANAVTYSPENTRVAIGVEPDNGSVSIIVADQGRGIPGQELDRIFERFYRVDQARSRSTGGTGLGLSIVKHICLNHGGDISVRSKEGVGSTFTMRINRHQDSPEGV